MGRIGGTVYIRPGGEIKIFLHKCIPPSTSSFLGPVAQWKLIRLIELIAFNLWPNCLWNWPTNKTKSIRKVMKYRDSRSAKFREAR